MTSRLLSNIAQLRERRERLFSLNHADRQAVGVGLRSGREEKRKKRILIVLFENDDGAGEFAALGVGLVSDVLSQSDPLDFALPKR